MAIPSKAVSMDTIFSLGAGRSDRWRELLVLAKQWARDDQADASLLRQQFSQLQEVEILHAYPGRSLMNTLQGHLDAERKEPFVDLAARISFSILARYYKDDPREWDASTEHEAHGEVGHSSDSFSGRPYFEVLIVVAFPPKLEP